MANVITSAKAIGDNSKMKTEAVSKNTTEPTGKVENKVINSAKEIGKNLKMKMAAASKNKTEPIRKVENNVRKSGYIGM